jgi:UDP-N-acetyl-2-amino-2-deoxyglucuronate dehydrogenase
LHSWKGDFSKSGGLAANIGIHFFDMLIWIFGNPISLNVFEKTDCKISGILNLEFAKVRWSLSIDSMDLPEHCKQSNQRAYRSLMIDGKEFEFSSGFTDLHTVTYKNILAGNGFGLEDAMASLSIVKDIRSSKTNFNY